MGASDMFSSGFDADAAQYARNNRTQQPDFAPGMGGDPFAGAAQDMFGQSTMPNNQTAAGDIFSTGMNGAGGGFDPFNQVVGMPGQQVPGQAGMFNPNMPSPNAMMQPNMMQRQPQEDSADKFWRITGQAFKGAFSFFSSVSKSFGQLTALWWYKYSFKVIAISGACIVIGIIGALFKLGVGSSLVIAGFLSMAGSLTLFGISYSSVQKSGCNKLYKDEEPQQQPMQTPPPQDFNSNFSQPSMSFDDAFPQSDFDGDTSFDDDNVDSFFTDDEEDEDEDDWNFTGGVAETVTTPPMSSEEALNSMPDIQHGMYERNFLFETLVKRLPSICPDFATVKEIDEDSETFLLWGEKLIEAGICAGCKEDATPELISLKETIFSVIVKCTRPVGCKPDAIGEELAQLYSYNEETDTFKEGIFATTKVVGTNIIITIFNGESATVSLRDMMMHEQGYFKDTKNYMPVVLGIDQMGNCILTDFKKLESIIVTGMPRSGKSWFVKAVLLQMAALLSPADLNIMVCDPKEGTSDYIRFCVPHVKRFESDDKKVLDLMRTLVRVEGAKRRKIIGDAGCINYWTFKDRYPDVKMPLIYLVIDEVVTFASRMDKECFQEFRMLLRELITQLPNLGIRAIIIPHMLNNDIIEKKTSDVVLCRISVKGDADHIEKATGSKFRDFPYKLVHNGDMAIRLTGHPNTLFVHGAVIGNSDEEIDDVFDYVRRVWAKLEPDEKSDASERARLQSEIGTIQEDIEKESDDSLLASSFTDEALDTSVF